jgi:hypothetical protein
MEHYTYNNGQEQGRVLTQVTQTPLLARAAVDAIRTWLFLPARCDGVLVETESSTVFEVSSN